MLNVCIFFAVLLNSQPHDSLQGKNLKRPEGISFTRDGAYAVIANSNANNILFYRISEKEPAFILKNRGNTMNYPHDVDFSADGEILAVASRGNNKLSLHRKNETGFYDEVAFKIFEGKTLGLQKISAVKFHPKGGIIAFCDGAGSKAVLIRYEDETKPYRIIQEDLSVLHDPDGLAFSKDGKLLAITSHRTHSVIIYEEGESGVYSESPVQIIEGDLCYPHSVAFHPLDDTLVISSAGGRKTLAVYPKLSDTAPFYGEPAQVLGIFNPKSVHHQKWFPEEGGIKGVCFSPDGRILGLSASDITDPRKEIQFYSVD